MKKDSDPMTGAQPAAAPCARSFADVGRLPPSPRSIPSSLARWSRTRRRTPTAAEAPTPVLKEIVVTAQRRKQTVQDVPYNISVIDPKQIDESGATTLNDLTRDVPGLVTVDTGPGSRGGMNNLTLRGLRTDSPGGGQSVAEIPGESVSPVSTYFGETPVFFAMPLYDVQRVEVLRGPQGTLYGSGSQAGTIRIIPNPPEFDRFSGEIEGTASDTDHASSFDNLNRDFQGYLNIPLASHLAAADRRRPRARRRIHQQRRPARAGGPGTAGDADAERPWCSHQRAGHRARGKRYQHDRSVVCPRRVALAADERHRAAAQLRAPVHRLGKRAVFGSRLFRRCAQSDDRKPRAALGGKPGGVARFIVQPESDRSL